MSPDTERALVELALARGLVSPAQVEAVTLESRRAVERGHPRTIARLLVDRGTLSRDVATRLLQEVRAARGPSGVHATLALPHVATTLAEPPRPRPASEAPTLPGPARRPSEPPPPAPAPAPRSVQTLGPGAVVGAYRITGELGRGGMGVVYRAQDERLGREVAIKTISGLADAEAVERFLREARAAARVRHPGIVQVLEAGSLSGLAYVVLELVAGGSLSKKLEKGPLAPHDAATLVRDLALAVHAAHQEGIVHRDLKPANVLLEPDGRPRLTDFGLARDDRWASLTETGVALGTPAYMAPEQASADRKAIGPATDVYGLGAVLYHALTGTPPFQGGTGLAIMHKVVTEEVEPPSRRRSARGLAPLARDLETVCAKALEKRPEARYASARELSEDLARYLGGEPIVARPHGLATHLARAVRRNRALALVASLGVAGILAVALAAHARTRAAEDLAAAKHAAEVRSAADLLEKAVAELTSASTMCPTFQHPTTARLRENVLAAGAVVLDRARTLTDLSHDGDSLRRQREAAELVFVAALRLESPSLAEVAGKIADERGWEKRCAAALDRFQRAATARDIAEYAAGAAQDRDFTRAEWALAQALKQDPESLEALSVRVTLERLRGDRAALRRANDAFLAREPYFVPAHVLRIQDDLERHDLDAALADVKAARRIAPRDPGFLEVAAQVAAERGEWEDCVADATAYAEVRPFSALGYVMRGWGLLELHRAAEAVPVLEKARELLPNPTNRVTLARAYVTLGRVEEAKAELRSVIELAGVVESVDPKIVEQARQVLANLEKR